MFKDSSSPRSDYQRLLNWLQLPETQEALEVLKEEADNLTELLKALPVAREIGMLFGNLLHREQSLGEARGLERLQNLINDRKLELEQALDLAPKPKAIPQDEY